MPERNHRLTEPCRDDLTRSVPFHVRSDVGSNSDGLTLEGYAATFNSDTEINSWEGNFLERIAPGAFKKTIRERTPRLQFDHGYHPLIGSIPIGKIESLSEDETGLNVQARLSDNWLIQPVREAIAQGAIDGMSFRFSVVREDWTDSNGKRITDPNEIMDRLMFPGEDGLLVRTLKEVKCTELGPVVWPAYESTSVGVRSKVVIDLANLRSRETQAELARALFLADAANRNDDTSNEHAESPVNHESRDAEQSPVDNEKAAPDVHLSADEMRKKARRQRMLDNVTRTNLSLDRNNKNG